MATLQRPSGIYSTPMSTPEKIPTLASTPLSVRARIAAALRQNLIPGLILQLFALLLVLAYYHVEPITEVCVRLGQFKVKWGFLFSAISTGLFGGLLPFSILIFMKKVPHQVLIATGIYYLFFWMWKGVEVDLLYRVQSLLFGDGTDAPTILKKVVVDQFGFNLFYSVPSIALTALWKDHGFIWSATRHALNHDFFKKTIPSMMLSTWMIWLPTTAIVYSMPAPLQVPLFNIVLCFYVLIATVIGQQAND